MTDLNQTYKRLAKTLTGSRNTLQEVCADLGIDVDLVDDEQLAHFVAECSHCDIWGTTHRTDEDGFAVCVLCFRLVGQ